MPVPNKLLSTGLLGTPQCLQELPGVFFSVAGHSAEVHSTEAHGTPSEFDLENQEIRDRLPGVTIGEEGDADKKIEEGGQVWIRARERENAARIEVETPALEIHPEKPKELFEPFRQESEGIGRKYEGSSLGLTIASRAPRQMGGSIEMETKERGKLLYPSSSKTGKLNGAVPSSGAEQGPA